MIHTRNEECPTSTTFLRSPVLERSDDDDADRRRRNCNRKRKWMVDSDSEDSRSDVSDDYSDAGMIDNPREDPDFEIPSRKADAGVVDEKWLKEVWPLLRVALIDWMSPAPYLPVKFPPTLDSVIFHSRDLASLLTRHYTRDNKPIRFSELPYYLRRWIPSGEKLAMALALCNIIQRVLDRYEDLASPLSPSGEPAITIRLESLMTKEECDYISKKRF
jgi:hypothetical protein